MPAQALRQRIAPEGAPPPTALVGGLIEPGGLLRPRLTALLAREGFQTLDRPVDPARGSVRMALEA